MRLINTTTIQLHEFHGNAVPIYAILSHRWGEKEVSFQAMQSGKASECSGWSKIEKCCALAARKGFHYVWIDTCCIDKTSSTELSESINSMFNWYEEASQCFVYLDDVSASSLNSRSGFSEFWHSKWFTRAWTLQELLAPPWVEFFNASWEQSLGNRQSLSDILSEITGIYLKEDWTRASVAEKMSWASSRQCSRAEDVAYSLLGLFEVNMPLLYGEGGHRAFKRLQLEILKESDDETIFAWNNRSAPGEISGMLARSPMDFSESKGFVRFNFGREREPYTMTNKGLQFHAALIPWPFSRNQHEQDAWLIPLNCIRPPRSHTSIDELIEDKRNPTVVGVRYLGPDSFVRDCSISLFALSNPPFRNSMEDIENITKLAVGTRMWIYMPQPRIRKQHTPNAPMHE